MIRVMFTKRRVYLDYAAATPLAPAARRAMRACMGTVYGNPSAIHHEGRLAKQVLEEARTNIARVLQVKPDFVTFTSGGTESNNLAITGVIEALVARGRSLTDMEIITTPLEHPSVGVTLRAIEKRGVKIIYAPVDVAGSIDVDGFKHCLTSQTVLVVVSHVNSEIGTIQPLHRLRKVMKEHEHATGTVTYLHVDAAQSPLWLSCQFGGTSADLLTLDFGKCGGPKGVGALIRSPRTELLPYTYGGGQERGLRPGTESVMQITGGVAAFIEAQLRYKDTAKRVQAVRDAGIALLTACHSSIVCNGATGDARVANNINISIPGTDTEFLTTVLDSRGIAVSTKSACAGAGGGESVVVKTISGDSARAQSTLRLTLGPGTTVRDIERVAKVISAHLTKMAPWQKVISPRE